MLTEVRKAGEMKYNGRARRTIEALERAGLVEYDFELIPHAIGSWGEQFTVRPLDPDLAGAGNYGLGIPRDEDWMTFEDGMRARVETQRGWSTAQSDFEERMKTP